MRSTTTTTTGSLRRLGGALSAAALMLLAGCGGTIKQDVRVNGDVSRLEGVTQVTASMSPDAAKQQVDNPQFNRDELATRLRQRLEAKGLTAPNAAHRVEIVVTDVRVRGAFAAIMFGFMAGDDHVSGRVRVLDPAGRALRSFDVHANYAFGGVAGGQDGVRMNWLYDKFADMAMAELSKVVLPPRAGAASIPPASAALPAGSPPVPVVAPVPAAVSAAAIDNADAVPVGERGRAGYRDWLAQATPRAFVVSDSGHWYSTWSDRPKDPNEPRDPSERALKRCNDAGRPHCTLYAVDNRVVYVRPNLAAPQ
jgi:hypothetical protein